MQSSVTTTRYYGTSSLALPSCSYPIHLPRWRKGCGPFCRPVWVLYQKIDRIFTQLYNSWNLASRHPSLEAGSLLSQ
jgi:hypothetical protein